MSDKNMVKCPQCGFNSKAGAPRCPRCNKALYKIDGCNGACHKCFHFQKGNHDSDGCCGDAISENTNNKG